MTGDCVIWAGRRDADGYGRTNGCLAHRVAYERRFGPIPDGLQLDHLCRNRACVNPEHLEPVTHAENMRRSAPAQKTKCSNGHAYDDLNTYIRPTGQRDCRVCIRERQARHKARRSDGEAA